MINKFIKNPWRIFNVLASRGLLAWIPDKIYLKIRYRATFNKKLNLNNPQTFSEKLQWLKLYDRKPEYSQMVDKYEVKKYVSKKIGDEYVIPTIGIWNKFNDIDFNSLPEQFVLKCTHDSGGLVICKDKSKFDLDDARKKIQKSLKHNYYKWGREWVYKNVKPRIIAEPYMEDQSGELRDYKLMMFNGKHRCTFTCTQRYDEGGLKVTFFDRDWNVMPFERHYPKSTTKIEKPASYDKMVKLATILSNDLTFVRCDFYEVNGNPYFGELTFFPGSGLEKFNPEKWDKIFGEWIDLPNKKIQ